MKCQLSLSVQAHKCLTVSDGRAAGSGSVACSPYFTPEIYWNHAKPPSVPSLVRCPGLVWSTTPKDRQIFTFWLVKNRLLIGSEIHWNARGHCWSRPVDSAGFDEKINTNVCSYFKRSADKAVRFGCGSVRARDARGLMRMWWWCWRWPGARSLALRPWIWRSIPPCALEHTGESCARPREFILFTLVHNQQSTLARLRVTSLSKRPTTLNDRFQN